MDLIADIGNTRTHLAFVDPSGQVQERVDIAHAEWNERWPGLVSLDLLRGSFAVSSVNAPALARVREAIRASRGVEARVLRVDLPDPLPLLVDEPAGVGSDRVANAFWAAKTYPGQAVVVIDLGTAVTYNVVSSEGAFLGGAIAAGLGTSARALAGGTDLLPQVRFEPGAAPAAIGKSTVDCLVGGLLWAVVGAVEATCREIAKELGTAPHVVATGGDAALIAPHCAAIHEHVPDVTLRGVWLALQAAGG